MPAHWKSSAAGILSAVLGAVGPITAYLATTNNPKATEICGALTCAAAIARIWLGLIQSDAPTAATTPPAEQATGAYNVKNIAHRCKQ